MTVFYSFGQYFNEIVSVRQRLIDNGLVNLLNFDLISNVFSDIAGFINGYFISKNSFISEGIIIKLNNKSKS